MTPSNEALDCRVYARAAAWLLGIDRWDDARWSALEGQIAPEALAAGPANTQAPSDGNDETETTPPIAGRILKRKPRARRSYRARYME
ncbi:hypothetical protein [Roseinatronobacter sp.]